MMRERKGPLLENEKLLIRGEERQFIDATVKSSDLQLWLHYIFIYTYDTFNVC